MPMKWKWKPYHSTPPSHQLHTISWSPHGIAFLTVKKSISAVHVRRGRSIRIEPTHPHETLAFRVDILSEGLNPRPGPYRDFCIPDGFVRIETLVRSTVRVMQDTRGVRATIDAGEGVYDQGEIGTAPLSAAEHLCQTFFLFVSPLGAYCQDRLRVERFFEFGRGVFGRWRVLDDI